MSYSALEASHRAGVTEEYLRELVRLGLLEPGDGDTYSAGDARRAACFQALGQGGVPIEALATGVAAGSIDLGFLDEAAYERFATTTDETFAQVATRTNVPIELLAVIRESLGSPAPNSDDYVREYELSIVPFLSIALQFGYGPVAIDSILRVTGDSLRRVAETEGDLFYSEILAPRITAGLSGPLAIPEGSDMLAAASDGSVLAILHGQQAQTWLRNVVRAIGTQLELAGLHHKTERPPAICFLDVTGYTRLTQEHGDSAAADLAERLARVVQRASTGRGGKPVKWLGDGVMFYFEDPASAVAGALEMVSSIRDAGMPPAHVGVASGEVLFQQGDYFGQTVNLAARIADFARPNEVLVSHEVVAASAGAPVDFSEIGPVELKGVSGAVRLYAARSKAA